MLKTIENNNILIQWLSWRFHDVLKEIFNGWKNFLLFGLNYFSLPLILKTFFSPWRRYSWDYGRAFRITKYLEVFFSNLISRVLGAIVRTFLILIGVVAEIFIFLAGLVIFIGWLFLPIILIGGIIFSIKIIS